MASEQEAFLDGLIVGIVCTVSFFGFIASLIKLDDYCERITD